MFVRSILIAALLSVNTVAFADDVLADLDPDFDTELEEIKNSPTASDKSKNERRKASFNALDEEDEFEMNLSEPVDTNTTAITDPDAELEPLVEENLDGDVTGIDEASPSNENEVLNDIEEIVPTPVDEAAKEIEWDLDLDEDIEIGDKKITTKEKDKSEPVDLDFLEEEE